MTIEQMVTSVNGKKVPVKAETICIHGDGKNAVDFAKSINESLTQSNVKIESVN